MLNNGQKLLIIAKLVIFIGSCLISSMTTNLEATKLIPLVLRAQMKTLSKNKDEKHKNPQSWGDLKILKAALISGKNGSGVQIIKIKNN